MCRVYGVTRAGYYAWRSRECSERERGNEALAEQIRAVHLESRGTYGKVTDNAFIESFFHSMKSEVFHGYRFNDREVRAVLKNYLPFYNRDRLHSSLDYVSPATFERRVR
jgi:transposase InsO family protein